MSDKSSLIPFPCDFSIKIIGVLTDSYRKDIRAIIQKHYPATQDCNIISKGSKKANYLAITATVYAKDKASLDALYKELTLYPGIKMVL